MSEIQDNTEFDAILENVNFHDVGISYSSMDSEIRVNETEELFGIPPPLTNNATGTNRLATHNGVCGYMRSGPNSHQGSTYLGDISDDSSSSCETE